MFKTKLSLLALLPLFLIAAGMPSAPARALDNGALAIHIADAPTALFADNFESGSTNNWSQVSVDPGNQVDVLGSDGAVSPEQGGKMLRITEAVTTTTSKVELYKNLNTTATVLYWRAYLYIPSSDYNTFTNEKHWSLGTLRGDIQVTDPVSGTTTINRDVAILVMRLRKTGNVLKFAITGNYLQFGLYDDAPMPLDQWVLIEGRCEIGSSQAVEAFWKNGALVKQATVDYSDVLRFSKAAIGFSSQGNYADTGVVYYDDFRVSDGYTGSGSGDTTPPSVAITSPANGASVTHPIDVSATAADDMAIARVTFLLDGVPQYAATGNAGAYTWSWNGAASPGNHTIAARAEDLSNNMSTTQINISIPTPPTSTPTATSTSTATPPQTSTSTPTPPGSGPRNLNSIFLPLVRG